MPGKQKKTVTYEGRRTLIIGEVNTGKTRLTEQVLAGWTAQGRSKSIAVLDLAPAPQKGIGGRLNLPAGFEGVFLTTAIVPPRLTARDEEEAAALAGRNAAAIETLLQDTRLAACTILVINDVTLYLQAGRYDHLMRVIRTADTALFNAYYGNSFPDYTLSRRERRLTEKLMQDCDQVIRMPEGPSEG